MHPQGSTFAISLVYGCTTMVDVASQASQLAGYTHRITTLLHCIADIEHRQAAVAVAEHQGGLRSTLPSLPSTDDCNNLLLECRNLEVAVPSTQRVLLQQVSFAVFKGSSLLLTGHNGCGKSSLLRVLHGMWPVSRGRVRCISTHVWQKEAALLQPDERDLTLHSPDLPMAMFLPQSPHLLPVATMREQLTYPRAPTHAFPSDADARAALAIVSLEKVVDRLGGLDCRCNGWRTLLSPGRLSTRWHLELRLAQGLVSFNASSQHIHRSGRATTACESCAIVHTQTSTCGS